MPSLNTVNTVDHVLIAVRDPEVAADRLRERFGLGALPGGSPWPGIANMVVPLGPPAYLELVYVTDPAASDEAAMIERLLADGDRLLTWVIEPEDFDATVERTGETPTGDADSPWRTLGGVRPDRPFFIRYSRDREARREGWQKRVEQAEPSGAPGAITAVEMTGDDATIRGWIGYLGSAELTVVPGKPRLRSITVDTGAGPIVIRDADLRG